MKKFNDAELKIYESLGVKQFRELVIAFYSLITMPFTIRKTKEERKKLIYNTGNNYFIGKNKNLDKVKDFKKMLYLNTGIHLYGLYICYPTLSKILSGAIEISSSASIINLVCIVINLYCIMLQRYNCVRINKLVEKMTPLYERKKDKVKEELIKEDSLLSEHKYKVKNKKNKASEISFDSIIENASLEELKQIRSNLEYCKKMDQTINNEELYFDKGKVDFDFPTKKNKSLVLELKTNNNIN